MDTEACTVGVAAQDLVNSVFERISIGAGDGASASRGSIEQLIDGDDEPERCVHRVELRRLAAIRKAIGQHALGDRLRPLEEEAQPLVDAIGCETDSSQRDE